MAPAGRGVGAHTMRITDYTPNRVKRARHNLTTMTPDDMALIADALETHSNYLRSMGETLANHQHPTAAKALKRKARQADRITTEINLLERE